MRAKLFNLLKLLHRGSARKQRSVTRYISCKGTVAAAKAQGLSVSDYVEKLWDQKGGAKSVIDKLTNLNVFDSCHSMIEIGGGTGRYIEKILDRHKIASISSYELAEDWSIFLEEKYSPVLIRRDADGRTLKYDGDESVDLTIAHGVFVYLPFLAVFEYLIEMIRVTKPGGFIIFDIYSRNFFGFTEIDAWLHTPDRYPVVFDPETIIDFFRKKECTFVESFNNKYGHSFSTYLIFRKKIQNDSEGEL